MWGEYVVFYVGIRGVSAGVSLLHASGVNMWCFMLVCGVYLLV